MRLSRLLQIIMIGSVLFGLSSSPCFLVLEMLESPSLSFHPTVLCKSVHTVYLFTSHQSIHVRPTVSQDGVDGYR